MPLSAISAKIVFRQLLTERPLSLRVSKTSVALFRGNESTASFHGKTWDDVLDQILDEKLKQRGELLLFNTTTKQNQETKNTSCLNPHSAN